MQTPVWFDKEQQVSGITGFAGTMIEWLGINFTALGPDWLEGTMPVDHRTQQPYGRLHGGASLVLAETLGSTAGMLVVDPSKFAVAGAEINGNHLRPVYSGLVRGVATAEMLGRSTQVWSVRIFDEAQKLICISRLTLAVFPRDRA